MQIKVPKMSNLSCKIHKISIFLPYFLVVYAEWSNFAADFENKHGESHIIIRIRTNKLQTIKI